MIRVGVFHYPPVVNECALNAAVACDVFGVGREWQKLEAVFGGVDTEYVPLRYDTDQIENNLTGILLSNPHIDVLGHPLAVDELLYYFSPLGYDMAYPVSQVQ